MKVNITNGDDKFCMEAKAGSEIKICLEEPFRLAKHTVVEKVEVNNGRETAKSKRQVILYEESPVRLNANGTIKVEYDKDPEIQSFGKLSSKSVENSPPAENFNEYSGKWA